MDKWPTQQITSYHTTRSTSSIQPEFDVTLMDIEMPHMDGIACIGHIRALEAEGTLRGRVIVVAVTANARMEHVRTALEAGMDAVTTKPYRMDDLVAQMEKAYIVALSLRNGGNS
jgi:CheY-like chemotaxis protein